MQLFFHNLGAGMEFIPRLTLTGIIEILIISWMTYAFLTWVMDTKAWILLRGLLLIVAFVGFCTLFHLNTILWLMGPVSFFSRSSARRSSSWATGTSWSF